MGVLSLAGPRPQQPGGRAARSQRVRRRFREGIATYLDTRLLHHYLGFRVFQTELLRNEQRKVVEGLYAELAHTTGSGAGFEAGTAPFGDRIVDDVTTPHGWFAAEYVALLRNMLVREQGNDVYLMSALSPAWLRPGKRISVARAPDGPGPRVLHAARHEGRRGADLEGRRAARDAAAVARALRGAQTSRRPA